MGRALGARAFAAVRASDPRNPALFAESNSSRPPRHSGTRTTATRYHRSCPLPELRSCEHPEALRARFRARSHPIPHPKPLPWAHDEGGGLCTGVGARAHPHPWPRPGAAVPAGAGACPGARRISVLMHLINIFSILHHIMRGQFSLRLRAL